MILQQLGFVNLIKLNLYQTAMYFGICILFAFVLTWGVSLQTLVYKIAKEEKSLGADDIVLSSPVVDWNKYNRELLNHSAWGSGISHMSYVMFGQM